MRVHGVGWGVKVFEEMLERGCENENEGVGLGRWRRKGGGGIFIHATRISKRTRVRWCERGTMCCAFDGDLTFLGSAQSRAPLTRFWGLIGLFLPPFAGFFGNFVGWTKIHSELKKNVD